MVPLLMALTKWFISTVVFDESNISTDGAYKH